VVDTTNPYVFPILRASESSYSFNTESTAEELESKNISGSQLSLVSGYQSRNNHRAVISGSIDMCSDELMGSSPDNEKFCQQLINWAMQESGVLRSTGLRHMKEGTEAGDKNPENYDLESHVEF
jgi:oligosaccharyltransferase complex subunit beta